MAENNERPLKKILDKLDELDAKTEAETTEVLDKLSETMAKNRREKLVCKVTGNRAIFIPTKSDIQANDYVIVKKLDLDEDIPSTKKILTDLKKEIDGIQEHLKEIKAEVTIPDPS